MRRTREGGSGQDGLDAPANAAATRPAGGDTDAEHGAEPGDAPTGGGEIDVLRGRVAPDPVRVAEGWTPRFVVGPDRLEEVVWLYRELGFDVIADPVRPVDMEQDCRDCRLLVQLRFRYVYTRGAGAGPR